MPEYSHISEKSRPIDTSAGDVLFRTSLVGFQRRLERNPERAFRHFGMTLVHSLPLSQRVRLRERLGLTPDNATSHYNLGMVAVAEKDWSRAIAEFAAALEKDETMLEALYNQALATERSGADAKGLYERFVRLAGDDPRWAEDVAAVKGHLDEV
jgi:tetratricopeptide (TPR) repeat protein